MPASLEVCSYDFNEFMAFGLKCLIVCLRSASFWHNPSLPYLRSLTIWLVANDTRFFSRFLVSMSNNIVFTVHVFTELAFPFTAWV